jgi:hypothetical protein
LIGRTTKGTFHPQGQWPRRSIKGGEIGDPIYNPSIGKELFRQSQFQGLEYNQSMSLQHGYFGTCCLVDI